MSLEQGMAAFEHETIGKLLLPVKTIEEYLDEKLARGQVKLASPEAQPRDQIWYNYLNTWKRRIVAVREILEQKVIVICQDGDQILIVTRLDESTTELIREAEKHGAEVVNFEKAAPTQTEMEW